MKRISSEEARNVKGLNRSFDVQKVYRFVSVNWQQLTLLTERKSTVLVMETVAFS